MIIPIRCFTCGKVTGNMWNSYQYLLSQGIEVNDALTKLGLLRICCRRMLFTHVNLIDEILEFRDQFQGVKNESDST